jgi:outer membrane protein assembly factor BamB
MRALLIRSIPVLAALAGGLALVLWLRATPGSLEMRLEAAGTQKMGLAPVEFRGEDFRKGQEEAVSMAGAWPCFRGEDHSGVSREEIPLTRTWGAGGPKPLWEVPVGIGYAAPAIRGGLVYLLDYDEAEQADVLRCLSLATGKEVWRRWYKVAIDSDHGISRTVPAVNDQYVVTIGPKCHVLCCDSKTGDLKWGLDMADRYQTQWPKWYAGQCPLIDMDKAILAPAGKDVLMVAVECETGKVLWKTPNPRGWKMTHSSIVPMDFKEGWRMYVYCGSGGVVGVAADDAGDTIKAGDILWEFDQWRVPFANVPSPVMIGDGRILLSGGYDHRERR